MIDGVDPALLSAVLDPKAAMAALPQEERDEHERCRRSIVEARRSAERVEGLIVVGARA